MNIAVGYSSTLPSLRAACSMAGGDTNSRNAGIYRPISCDMPRGATRIDTHLFMKPEVLREVCLPASVDAPITCRFQPIQVVGERHLHAIKVPHECLVEGAKFYIDDPRPASSESPHEIRGGGRGVSVMITLRWLLLE